jgi:hypothetical protein
MPAISWEDQRGNERGKDLRERSLLSRGGLGERERLFDEVEWEWMRRKGPAESLLIKSPLSPPITKNKTESDMKSNEMRELEPDELSPTLLIIIRRSD